MVHAVDRRHLSVEEFKENLRRFGFFPGATIYVHTSMDKISRRVPGITPTRLMELLKELVGKEGTLMVPTFPFDGLQYHYIQSVRVFNVQRTPSLVGLFTEVFRRSEGVVRSRHPTHPIAAWGRHSRELVAEHHLGTAFGEKSPVYKMQDWNGLVAGLGVTPKRCFTPYHVAEELHPKSHAMHYRDEYVEMVIVDGEEKFPYRIKPMRPDRLRRYGCGERILKRERILRYERIKGLEFSSASVHEFLARSSELISADCFYSRVQGY
jgi:aminoglycoside N3'-acetyltransferase